MLEIKLFLATAAVRFRNSFQEQQHGQETAATFEPVYPVPSTAGRGEGPPLPPKPVREAVPTPAHFSPPMVKGTRATGSA